VAQVLERDVWLHARIGHTVGQTGDHGPLGARVQHCSRGGTPGFRTLPGGVSRLPPVKPQLACDTHPLPL